MMMMMIMRYDYDDDDDDEYRAMMMMKELVDSTCSRKYTPVSPPQVAVWAAHCPMPPASRMAPHTRQRAGTE